MGNRKVAAFLISFVISAISLSFDYDDSNLYPSSQINKVMTMFDPGTENSSTYSNNHLDKFFFSSWSIKFSHSIIYSIKLEIPEWYFSKIFTLLTSIFYGSDSLPQFLDRSLTLS